MNKGYLRTIVRFLRRNKTYTVLNLVCLSFGLTCAIIALLYIQTFLNHDKFNKNYDRLYSVEAIVTYFNGDRFPKEYISASLNDILAANAPEIEGISRVVERSHSFIKGDESFMENGIYADSNFFDLFTYAFLSGNGNSALTQNSAIILSEQLAIKLFGTTDCLGRSVALKDGQTLKSYNVSGVLQGISEKSVMEFDFILPFSEFLASNESAMAIGATACRIWALLGTNADKDKVNIKIKNLIKDQEPTLNQDIFLFPLGEKILYSYANGKRVWRQMQYIVIVGCIGFAILLIACFNFINLSVAMNIKRYREAGIRKVTGASRSAIVLQYLGETLFITLVSLVIAAIITDALLFAFNRMFNADVHLYLADINTILFFVAVLLFTTLMSGLIPALYLSSSDPINVLKGKAVKSHSYSTFRQGLIVFQFSIPIVLIICMIIISEQNRFLRNYDVGVDRDKLIVIENSKNIKSHSESVREELLKIPGVDAVSFTNCLPSMNAAITSEVDWDGRDKSAKLDFWCINTDFDYNKIVNIKMISGRYFSPSFSSDTAGYVINDIAARMIGSNDPVGSIISVYGNEGPVLGVFSGFHTLDLSGPIVPTIIRIKPENGNRLLVKFSSGEYPSIAGKIGMVYKQYETELLFQPELFRDYAKDSRLEMPSKLVGWASAIAIILACLGLLGLSAFTAESRTKEIGIRKINGATTGTVMRLLLKGYTKWITIAFFLALPFAFLIGKNFLGRYYFHTSMPYWAFIAGPLLAYSIALLTVGFQTWRAASRNPVETLRYE